MKIGLSTVGKIYCVFALLQNARTCFMWIRFLIFSSSFLLRLSCCLYYNIVTRNGKVIWKHGPYYWYFCLNLKYLGWPYTAKNGDFCEELRSETNFEAVLAFCVVMTMVPRLFWGSSDDRYKSKRVSQMLLVCYYLRNSQNIPINP